MPIRKSFPNFKIRRTFPVIGDIYGPANFPRASSSFKFSPQEWSSSGHKVLVLLMHTPTPSFSKQTLFLSLTFCFKCCLSTRVITKLPSFNVPSHLRSLEQVLFNLRFLRGCIILVTCFLSNAQSFTRVFCSMLLTVIITFWYQKNTCFFKQFLWLVMAPAALSLAVSGNSLTWLVLSEE